MSKDGAERRFSPPRRPSTRLRTGSWKRGEGRGAGRFARGFSLIELIVAIIIISIGVAALMMAFSTGVRGSADPVIGKQMLATAEEMMEEILLKPFHVLGTPPANGALVCGPAAARDSSGGGVFDDVRDYNGYQTTGICDIQGNAIPGLASYNLSVATACQPVAGVNMLQVTVTVSRGGDNVTLVSYKADLRQPPPAGVCPP
ncbi:MAG: prepilin-type N-terminal cleavage/methylation domain-containing protein [Azonexus sp.]|nr:prepilin-type N-terminal cleavage/methylation domain-containing protein [Azonexus sp.]